MQNSEFKQSLLVKHYEDTTFEALEANNGAPRPQFLYRRLGVEEATGGAYDAHVIKGVPGSKPPIAEHKHTELEFLFVYVLKGWMSFHYQGHGEHRLPHHPAWAVAHGDRLVGGRRAPRAHRARPLQDDRHRERRRGRAGNRLTGTVTPPAQGGRYGTFAGVLRLRSN